MDSKGNDLIERNGKYNHFKININRLAESAAIARCNQKSLENGISTIINEGKRLIKNEESQLINNLEEIETDYNTTLINQRRIIESSSPERFNYQNTLINLKNKILKIYTENERNHISKSENLRISDVKKRIFQRDNNISREARYPESKIFFVAVTLLIIVVETLLNAEGHRMVGSPLFEAIYVAFGISATNVIFSLFLGKCFTYKNLKTNSILKICAWSSLIIFIVSAVFLNGFYASYRSELLVGGTQPDLLKIIDKTIRIFIFDYPFNDLKSHLTFLITLIFSLFAFIEGYFISDPYPGYEDIDRDVRIKALELEEVETQIKEQIKKNYEDLKKEFTDKIHELEKLSPNINLGLIQKIQRIKDKISCTEKRINTETEGMLLEFIDIYSKLIGEEVKKQKIKNEITCEMKCEIINQRIEELNQSISNHNQEYLRLYQERIYFLENNLESFKNEAELITTFSTKNVEQWKELEATVIKKENLPENLQVIQ